MPASDYASWFNDLLHFKPHGWQQELGRDTRCRNRLIRIPTGFGKTQGVLGAWAYHRLIRRDSAWPRRLVLCLPMRVLAEQTEAAARGLLETLGALWNPQEPEHGGKVGVHVLMGGRTREAWHLYPEHEAVLIGTQDMLISRALNRGYACPRARWPMEYALLHHDVLWVLDEVQLMDVGLTTSVQLQARRDQTASKSLRPAVSWWMSATLQPDWFNTPDFSASLSHLSDDRLELGEDDRSGALWDVRKPCEVRDLARSRDRKCVQWAREVLDAHRNAVSGDFGQITLAIANTVDDASALFLEIEKLVKAAALGVDLHLVHSRFRGHERSQWSTFLSRGACRKGVNRVIVATQVVEAGVDISATTLVTELAPWPSLVQRIGRVARYGGGARVIVVDREKGDVKSALPYTPEELSAARSALDELEDLSPPHLEAFEAGLRTADPDRLRRLYPHDPMHVLTVEEQHDLFETGTELTGGDIDISRFIRDGEERDILVWWADVPESAKGERGPRVEQQPERDDLCRVPVHRAREWLKGQAAWGWDYLEGAWKRLARRSDLYPGQVVLIDARVGGYDPRLGWTGTNTGPVPGAAASSTVDSPLDRADRAQDDEALSEEPYRTIATHGQDVGEEVRRIASAIGLSAELHALLDLAGRVHDLGKAHGAFQHAIQDRLEGRVDLAKAPRGAWRRDQIYGPRRGFRHELVSTIALFELVRRCDPWHPALLGSHRELVDLGVLDPPGATDLAGDLPLISELVLLEAGEFDLVAYLVCCHHGKVRTTWQATPHDLNAAVQAPEPETEADPLAIRGAPLRGVCDDDVIPAIEIATAGGRGRVPSIELHLDLANMGVGSRYGESWSQRVLALRHRLSDHALAFLETLLRVADIRASQLRSRDPALSTGVDPEAS